MTTITTPARAQVYITAMRRDSASFAWGIRWETIERPGGAPLYQAHVPELFQTRRQARLRQRWLAAAEPLRPNPEGGLDRRRVRYIVFARRDDGRPR